MENAAQVEAEVKPNIGYALLLQPLPTLWLAAIPTPCNMIRIVS
jgi:hypothetical protein